MNSTLFKSSYTSQGYPIIQHNLFSKSTIVFQLSANYRDDIFSLRFKALSSSIPLQAKYHVQNLNITANIQVECTLNQKGLRFVLGYCHQVKFLFIMIEVIQINRVKKYFPYIMVMSVRG